MAVAHDPVELTLDQLLSNVPKELLDQPCADDHLLELSQSLSEWSAVSPFLGLKKTEEEEIQSHRNVKRQRIEVLRKWQEKYGARATYRCVSYPRVVMQLGEGGLGKENR